MIASDVVDGNLDLLLEWLIENDAADEWWVSIGQEVLPKPTSFTKARMLQQDQPDKIVMCLPFDFPSDRETLWVSPEDASSAWSKFAVARQKEERRQMQIETDIRDFKRDLSGGLSDLRKIHYLPKSLTPDQKKAIVSRYIECRKDPAMAEFFSKYVDLSVFLLSQFPELLHPHAAEGEAYFRMKF